MGVHRAQPAPVVEETPTQPAPDHRCDRAHAERAYWRVTSPTTGRELMLCRYHYRYYQIALAVLGWSAEEIKPEEIAA